MKNTVTADRVAVVSEMTRQKLKVKELAERACVGRCAVWKMRAGQPVYRTTARHIAAALGVPLEALLATEAAEAELEKEVAQHD